MSVVILCAVAAVILFVVALAMTGTNLQQLTRQNFKHLLALSALLVPMVTVLSACNNVSAS